VPGIATVPRDHDQSFCRFSATRNQLQPHGLPVGLGFLNLGLATKGKTQEWTIKLFKWRTSVKKTKKKRKKPKNKPSRDEPSWPRLWPDELR